VRGGPFPADAPKSDVLRLRLRYHTEVSRVTAGTRQAETAGAGRAGATACAASGSSAQRVRDQPKENHAPRIRSPSRQVCEDPPSRAVLPGTTASDAPPPRWGCRGHAVEANGEQTALHQVLPGPKDQQRQEPSGQQLAASRGPPCEIR
jgi:hypothetical protein